MIADWVYHDEPGNPHVHLMTSLRPLTESGFGAKKVAVIGADGQPVRNANYKIQYRLWAGEKAEFLEQRNAWLDLQNQHLALAGLEIRVDGRSYAERGIDIVPTTHIGVAAKAMQRKGGEAGRAVDLERLALHETKRGINAKRIETRPGLVLDMVTTEKSVFDERDVAKVIHRYIDDISTFQRLLTRVLASPEVLRLDVERVDLATGARIPPKLTTREMVELITEQPQTACQGCHLHLLNPLGYVTENFDALGRVRTEQRLFSDTGMLRLSKPVSTRGIPNVGGGEQPIEHPDELHALMLGGEFQTCFARQYFRFTFQRMEDDAKDGCLLRSLQDDALAGKSVREVLQAVALAPEFKRRDVR